MDTFPHQPAPAIPDILRIRFGFEAFRPGQEAVITRLLSGRSVLAVFPTAAGKSLCYQLPALVLDGVTLVVSPLIALMKDQVDALRALGIPAARLDSTLDPAETRDVLARLEGGALRLLYIAPERLGNERFLRRLRQLPLALLAVDEAHCISEWGHNFRPDYLRIARVAREVSVPRVLALTATATPAVAADIRAAFSIEEANHVQTGSRRENLRLVVEPCSASGRPARLARRLRRLGGSAIVYVTHQRTAEATADHLERAGLRAEAYHAGLDAAHRSRIQDGFMEDAIPIVVATIAFGMGIDKPDIRAVIHANLPKTLENYAQEIGRAGRDGKPAQAILLASADDAIPLANFIYGDTPTRPALLSLLREILSEGEVVELALHALAARHDIRPVVIATCLAYLEIDGTLSPTGPYHASYRFRLLEPEADLLARFDPGRGAFLGRVFGAARRGRTWLSLDPAAAGRTLGEARERIVSALAWLGEKGLVEVETSGWREGYRVLRRDDPEEAADRLHTLFRTREARDIERLGGVLAFAEHEGCLTRRLLAYFGEGMDAECGACSGCRRPGPRPLPATTPPPFGDTERALVRCLRGAGQTALHEPRQIARFLCGITSPGTTRARLTRDHRFGVFAEHPFAQVLDLVESTLQP